MLSISSPRNCLLSVLRVCIPRCSAAKIAKGFFRHIFLLKRKEIQIPSNQRAALVGRHVCLASTLSSYRAFCEALVSKHFKPLPNEASSVCLMRWPFMISAESTNKHRLFRIQNSCFLSSTSLYLTKSVRKCSTRFSSE